MNFDFVLRELNAHGTAMLRQSEDGMFSLVPRSEWCAPMASASDPSAEALATSIARLDQHTHLTPYETDLTVVTDHIDALVSKLVLAERERDHARGAAMEKHGGLTITGNVQRDVMAMWAQDKAALSSLKREVESLCDQMITELSEDGMASTHRDMIALLREVKERATQSG